MVRWHEWLKGHESEQAPRDGEGQGSLACRSLWGRKEWDTTEWLNNKILCAHTHTNTSSLPVTPPRWLITHIRVPVHGVMKKQGGGGWGRAQLGTQQMTIARQDCCWHCQEEPGCADDGGGAQRRASRALLGSRLMLGLINWADRPFLFFLTETKGWNH